MEFVNDLVGRDSDDAVDADVPLVATVALGAFAALLVGVTVATTVRAGLPSVAAGFAVAVAVLLVTVGVFELGRRVGSR